MVDTLVSGASASRRVGSTPIIRTRGQLRWKMSPFSCCLLLLRIITVYLSCKKVLIYETGIS